MFQYLLRLGIVGLASGVLCLAGCAPDASTPTGSLLAAKAGSDRPMKGPCEVVATARVHEDEGGGTSEEGGHEDESDGGPPIQRHFDLTGTCQLTHLGLVMVSGRLNVTGPLGLGGGQGESEAGRLAVRGRLAYVAANGDQLTGRYVPTSAVFTRAADGNGGELEFLASQRIGEACEPGAGCGGGGGGGMGGGGGEHEEEEPTSTGRFALATGTVPLLGRLRLYKTPAGGFGTIALTEGRVTY